MTEDNSSPVRILVVDDDAPSRQVVSEILGRQGHVLATAESAQSALSLHLEEPFDLIVSDIRMPGKDGLELLQDLRQHERPPLVILITAFGDMEGAAKALQGGAFEYLSKPFRPSELKVTVARAVAELRSVESIGPARQEDAALGLVGRSGSMINLYRQIARASSSDATVLIMGESGSGKELVARAIHNYSPKKDKPFVAINCGALTETLLESELFGHIKGAFTGADNNRKGLFEVASTGVLFLDEIGEISPRMQAQLLRVLQEREVKPVGASHSIPVSTRVITATNRDLQQQVRDGHFREDLLYRINVLVIHVPPLRERRDDVPLLVSHFLAKHGTDQKRHLDLEALEALIHHDWPGNVRQLENTIARALALTPGDRITISDLSSEIKTSPRDSLRSKGQGEFEPDRQIKTLSELNRAYAIEVLERVGGNKSRAAELLGIDRKTLYRLIKE